MKYLMCYEGYENGYEEIDIDSEDEITDIMINKTKECNIEYIEVFSKWTKEGDSVITSSADIVESITRKE